MVYGLFSFVNPSDRTSFIEINIAQRQNFSCEKYETMPKFHEIKFVIIFIKSCFTTKTELSNICTFSDVTSVFYTFVTVFNREESCRCQDYWVLVGFGRACAPVRCAHPSFWAHCHAQRALRATPHRSFAAPPKIKRSTNSRNKMLPFPEPARLKNIMSLAITLR